MIIISFSLLGMVLTTIWSFIIPTSAFSLYFYKEKDPVMNVAGDHNKDDRAKYFETIYGDINQTVLDVCGVKHLTNYK